MEAFLGYLVTTGAIATAWVYGLIGLGIVSIIVFYVAKDTCTAVTGLVYAFKGNKTTVHPPG